MKVTTTLAADASVLTRTRVADYLELTKPRVAVLVLFTVLAGALLAARGSLDLMVLLHTLAGTTLVAAGASALNQLLERHSDALMRRTENRPLPAGRLHPSEVLGFGCGLGFAGVVYLLAALDRPWAALVAAATFLCYVCVYTPLKRLTPLNTLIGAVPGALPPVIGWTAVRGSLGLEVLVLFGIVFLWQIPHFLAIAWIYRDDYARARMRMLPVADRNGVHTGRQMLAYCIALLPVSLAPVFIGGAGLLYLIGALALGTGFLMRAVGFARNCSNLEARRVLRASLIYLPALLALLLADGAASTAALALWR
jgi:protoheme IX farnesyltransferase